MHLLAEETTVISCPVETAYRYAADLERFGEWFPGVLRIVSANGLEHGQPGKEYLETVSVPLLRGTRQVAITVKQARPNQLLVTEGDLAPLMPRMEMSFAASGTETCSITWRMFSRNNGLLARIALLPLAKNVVRKRAAIGMARLKRNLESRPAPT